ncbi:MAG: quinone-dependent dihydroorotate dehydrogenase [Gammaproteobacteria bacterium]
MYSVLRQLLFKLEPEVAHALVLKGLIPLTAMMPNRLDWAAYQRPTHAFGLLFPNPIGLAAGLDKNAECVSAFSKLGFGFVEVGTLTPRPQIGNPKPRLFRLVNQSALINRMGFNNKGIDYFQRVIKLQKYSCRLGVNIGKNKDTPNENAHEDYLYCFNKAYPYADYITVNISSPNTPGLRALQEERGLKLILESLCEARERFVQVFGKYVPLVIKVAPDLSGEQLQQFAEVINQYPVQGVIATNTTISRPGLEKDPLAKEAGGLSGKPLAALSISVLTILKKALNSDIDIVSAGGIDSAVSAQERFELGARLIQVYTGLIYQGPDLIKALIPNAL